MQNKKSCPFDKLFLDNTTCVSSCTNFSTPDYKCLASCPQHYFHYNESVCWQNCDILQPSIINYTACAPSCPATKRYNIDMKCVATCPQNVFNGSTATCMASSAGCPLTDVSSPDGEVNCTAKCDFYDPNTKICSSGFNSSCQFFKPT